MDPKQNGQGPAPFDPKLKMAADDIKKILDQYDIAGVAVLHSPTHTEFLMKVDTDHSLAKMDGKKFKVDDIEPTIFLNDDDKKQWENNRREMIFKTLNMVINLQIVATNVVVALSQAQGYIREKFNIKTPPPPGPKFPPGGKMPKR
jgi:hypothetical protein